MKKISRPWSVTIPKIARVGGVNFIEIPPAQGNQYAEDDYYPAITGYKWIRLPLSLPVRASQDTAGNNFTATGDVDQLTVHFPSNSSPGVDAISIDIGSWLSEFSICGIGFEVTESSYTGAAQQWHEISYRPGGTWLIPGGTNDSKRIDTGEKQFIRIIGDAAYSPLVEAIQVANANFTDRADIAINEIVLESPLLIGFNRATAAGHSHRLILSNIRILVPAE